MFSNEQQIRAQNSRTKHLTGVKRGQSFVVSHSGESLWLLSRPHYTIVQRQVEGTTVAALSSSDPGPFLPLSEPLERAVPANQSREAQGQ